MKIFPAQSIKELDAYTIENEPIASVSAKAYPVMPMPGVLLINSISNRLFRAKRFLRMVSFLSC